MDIGRHRRARITLQRRGPGRKPSGQPDDVWIDVARPWARLLGKNGRETIAADKEVDATTVSMRIRYREDVTAQWRVIYRGAVYDIQAVLPDYDNREHVDLVAVVGASRG
ncbi:phage head closure protein [Cupriavidus sp. WS]|uniref:phage head closure protein n=1 Tax=Cupriavidus sp. WS TaxID=1312922 RepID=UPI000365E384|nr:phage head closure protein [Cupriavidus sp. WS]